jgi:hypothetical protein
MAAGTWTLPQANPICISLKEQQNSLSTESQPNKPTCTDHFVKLCHSQRSRKPFWVCDRFGSPWRAPYVAPCSRRSYHSVPYGFHNPSAARWLLQGFVSEQHYIVARWLWAELFRLLQLAFGVPLMLRCHATTSPTTCSLWRWELLSAASAAAAAQRAGCSHLRVSSSQQYIMPSAVAKAPSCGSRSDWM